MDSKEQKKNIKGEKTKRNKEQERQGRIFKRKNEDEDEEKKR